MSRPTQDTTRASSYFAYGALTLSGVFSQRLQLYLSVSHRSPTTPLNKFNGLGSFPFARRYLGNRFFFLFLQLLRCFSSLRLPLNTLTVFNDASLHRVPPFGYLRVLAYLQLSVAFRGSSRPSSASSAQAFTVRPSLLDLLPRSLFSVRFHNLFNDCLGFSWLLFSFQRAILMDTLWCLMEANGIEPMTSCVQSRRSPI